jgi:Protein of unknown function (DUF3352)
MSNATPPPTGPPSGPPYGPGAGPEYLDQGGGAPLGPTARSRKPVIIGAAAVVALGLAGGAAWAAASFFSTGAQPSEALPSSTLGYVSIDLDPSGGQKIEAVRTLNKFPAFKDELDLDTDDDLRKALFDEIQAEDECANLDYADDIEPWLGNRAAFAAVDLGEDTPTVALAIQVTDADAAEAGLAKISNCSATGDADTEGSGESESGGFDVAGEWAVVAETDDLAAEITAATEKGSLADDGDFQIWTARAGDPGIVSMYAAPEAGSVLAEFMTGEMLGEGLDTEMPGSDGSMEELAGAFEDFQGAAATIRFADGAVELESTGGLVGQAQALYASDRAGDVMSTLPADTVAAFGMGFEEGWMTAVVEQFSTAMGEDMTADELFEELSNQTGLDLPADAETMLGESAVVSLGGDFDVETMTNSTDGSDVPVGLKVKGDPDKIAAVLAKLEAQLPGDVASFVDTDAEGDMVAIGPDADYRAELLEGGDLGDSETFQDVIQEADQAAAIFYLDFDAGDDWLLELVGDDAETADNLAPLSALGMSVWQEDDVAHGVIRLTTD